MMNKLLKYECMAVGRILVPVWAGTAVLSLLSALIGRLNSSLSGVTGVPVTFVLGSFFQVLTALFIFATFAACVVVNIQRFYKLLGEQGYLMFSLPAAPWQHMAAKLLCACGATVASVLVVLGCLWMSATGTNAAPREVVSYTYSSQTVGSFIFLVLLLALTLVGGYLYLYLCMAIGSRWPQQRLLASIATYFVLGLAFQIVFMVMVVVAGLVLSHLPQEALQSAALFFQRLSASESGGAGTLAWCVGAVVLLLFAAADAILWAVTHHLISKHLNLP